MLNQKQIYTLVQQNTSCLIKYISKVYYAKQSFWTLKIWRNLIKVLFSPVYNFEYFLTLENLKSNTVRLVTRSKIYCYAIQTNMTKTIRIIDIQRLDIAIL